MTDKTPPEYQDLLSVLHETISSRAQTAIAARIELRDAVCRYVDAEQERGTSLAQIIKSVRSILTKAEEKSGHATDELAMQLIDWCRQFHGKRPIAAREVS